MTDWRSAELKHYGIRFRDGLTSRSREAFDDEMHCITKKINEATDNLPFTRRLIYKDKDWYTLMQREHGEKPGYIANGMEAIALINEAFDALNRASNIIGTIAMLEGGMKQNADGYSWSYHGAAKSERVVEHDEANAGAGKVCVWPKCDCDRNWESSPCRQGWRKAGDGEEA